MSDGFAGTDADWPRWKIHFTPMYDRGQQILDWAAALGDDELTPTMVRMKADEMNNNDIEKLDGALHSGLVGDWEA